MKRIACGTGWRLRGSRDVRVACSSWGSGDSTGMGRSGDQRGRSSDTSKAACGSVLFVELTTREALEPLVRRVRGEQVV